MGSEKGCPPSCQDPHSPLRGPSTTVITAPLSVLWFPRETPDLLPCPLGVRTRQVTVGGPRSLTSTLFLITVLTVLRGDFCRGRGLNGGGGNGGGLLLRSTRDLDSRRPSYRRDLALASPLSFRQVRHGDRRVAHEVGLPFVPVPSVLPTTVSSDTRNPDPRLSSGRVGREINPST